MKIEHGVKIDSSQPLMIDNGYLNGEPQDAVISYKGATIRYSGDRSNGAFEEFTRMFKAINTDDS